MREVKVVEVKVAALVVGGDSEHDPAAALPQSVGEQTAQRVRSPGVDLDGLRAAVGNDVAVGHRPPTLLARIPAPAAVATMAFPETVIQLFLLWFP
jgi:hypothetical protein